MTAPDLTGVVAVPAAIEAPHGAVLEFVLLFAVILLGPMLVRRAGVPGLVGLLLGGFLVGPHALGLIEAGNQTVPELGQLGLLYLMFVAGLELDLRVLAEYRRAAVTFGLLTFAVPFIAGSAVGFGLGWSAAAALLLGSLLASHTLLLYPMARDAGLGRNPAIASAVGATVLTDTLALAVLAVVAGTQTGSGSIATVLVEIGVGMVVLLVLALRGLPILAEWTFRIWGGDRAGRYVAAILSFLLMAMVAEVFGIEGIVGAFFAGLALNRLVPNEGPSMERIEFFGSAVFIPVFLVSVGLLLDPGVMFTAETLGLAGLLCAACIGGKAIAAALARPALGFSGAESGAMFVLTTPQAAATLAATLIGFQIGLFGTSVVNAVLVLILVSILSTTLAAPAFLRRVTAPSRRAPGLGERVLIVAPPAGPSDLAMRVADRITRSDEGLAELVIACADGQGAEAAHALDHVERRAFRGRLDGVVRRVTGPTVPEAVRLAVAGARPTIVLVDSCGDERMIAWLDGGGIPSLAAPTVVLRGDPHALTPLVVSIAENGRGAGAVAVEVAGRLSTARSRRSRAEGRSPAEPATGTVSDLTTAGVPGVAATAFVLEGPVRPGGAPD